jgi:hypothetical protein
MWQGIDKRVNAAFAAPMTKHPKRPRDFNQAAKLMVDIASGQVEGREPEGKDTSTSGRRCLAPCKGGEAMPIRRSPNGARHTPPQPGRDRPEQVVAINRNAWSQSIGISGRNHPVRAKIIKPLLAGVVRPRGRPPKVVAPLDQHYVALRDELQRTFQTIGLAA